MRTDMSLATVANDQPESFGNRNRTTTTKSVFSVTAHDMALPQIEQAGGKMISVPQPFCELQRDWQRKAVPAFMNLLIETGGTAGLQFS